MFKRFWADKSGNFATMLVVMTVPLMLALGLSVDLSRWVSAKSALQNVTDAAALGTAASSEKDDKALRTLTQSLLQKNGETTALANIAIDTLSIGTDNVDLRTTASFPTAFMSLVNINSMSVRAEALAERAVTGSIEVALVLDNTDSMIENDKIGTLKTAAKDLAGQLFDAGGTNMRIGLVPYAENINIGTENRYATWLSVPADYSVTKEGSCKTVTTKNGQCLAYSEKTTCTGTRDGVSYTYACGGGCTQYEQVPIDPKQVCTAATVTEYKWFGCIGSRVSGTKLVLNDDSPNVTYPGLIDTVQKCLTKVLPLTTDKSTILSGISGMITSRSGYTPNTYIPGGMMWGVNVLSATEPFTEGAPYDPANSKPRKVIVLMTDGLNSMRVITSNSDPAKIGTYATANATQQAQVNKDTLSICDYAKSKNIEIFSVAFMVDDTNAKSMLQNCATDASHYFDASDSAKFLSAFSDIAQAIKQVRLAR